MLARIAPAQAPYGAVVQAWLDKIMPKGMPPLRLFTTVARDERLFDRFAKGSLLDQGNLSLRQREIVIHRTTALCLSGYEWRVHAALFAEKAGLTSEQLQSSVHGGAADTCWTKNDKLLIRFCDALHARCDLGDQLWGELEAVFSPEALLELLLVAGFYRTVSYFTNALRLPPE